MTRHTYVGSISRWHSGFNRCPVTSCPLHCKSTNFKSYDQWRVDLRVHI